MDLDRVRETRRNSKALGELGQFLEDERVQRDVGRLTSTPEGYYHFNATMNDVGSRLSVRRSFEPSEVNERYIHHTESITKARLEFEHAIDDTVKDLPIEKRTLLNSSVHKCPKDRTPHEKVALRAFINNGKVGKTHGHYTEAADHAFDEALFWALETKDMRGLVSLLRQTQDPSLARSFVELFYSPRAQLSADIYIGGGLEKDQMRVYRENKKIKGLKRLVGSFALEESKRSLAKELRSPETGFIDTLLIGTKALTRVAMWRQRHRLLREVHGISQKPEVAKQLLRQSLQSMPLVEN